MRETETIAPRQPHLFRAADHLALWRMDEASGAVQPVDASGSYTTTAGTLPNSAGSLISALPGTNGSRNFNGTTHFASAPGNGTAATVFTPSARGQGYAIQAWINPTSVSVEGTIVAYGGTTAGEVLAGNALVSFRVNASGKLRLFWEHGAGVDTTIDASNMAALTAGITVHVGVIVRRTAANIECDFYVNGVMVDQQTTPVANVAAGGTTTPLFVLGRHSDTAEANLFFGGKIDDLRITSFAPSQAYMRDGYARGARSFDTTTMYANNAWESHVFVYVQYAQAATADKDRTIGYVDLSNLGGHSHLLEVEHSEDADDQGMTGSLKVRRQVFKQNIAPGFSAAVINDANFMGVMQRVKIELADVPIGYGRAAAAIFRQPMFEGVIQSGSWPSPEMTLKLIDRIRGLQRAWCRPKDDGTGVVKEQVFVTGADESMEQVIQDEITAFLPPTAGQYAVTDDDQSVTITPFFPAGLSGASFNITRDTGASPTPPFAFGEMNKHVAQAIEDLTNQIAWRARYRWDDFRKSFRYTVYGPNRAATWSSGQLDLTADKAVDWSELEISDDDIRNVIEVDHQEVATKDNVGEWGRFLQSVNDSASITKYGEAYATIAIGSTTNISDSTTATTLANNVLADLKDPKADGIAVIMMRAGIDIEDMVRARVDSQRFNADTDFSVSSVRYVYTATQRRVELGLRNGTPIAGHGRWFDRLIGSKGFRTMPGRQSPIIPGAPTLLRTSEGLKVSWLMPVARGNRKYSATEVHASTGGGGFTPSSATLQHLAYGTSCVLKGLSPLNSWAVKIVHRDSMRNASAASAATSATPRYAPAMPGFKATLAAGISTGLSSGKNPDFFTVTKTLTTETIDNFSNYDNSTGAGGGLFVAPNDGWYAVAAGLSATFGTSQSIFPIIRHKRSATVIAELDGLAITTGTTATGFFPAANAVTPAPSALVYMLGGDTLALGYSATAAPTSIDVSSNTYFAVTSLAGAGIQ